MNAKHLCISLLFIAFQVANGQDKTECSDNSQEHIEFLTEFYTEYISKMHDLTSTSFLEKYCTKNLLEKISNTPIDYDPFIFAQDNLPVSTLDYLKVYKYGTKSNVYEVSFPNSNEIDKDGTHIRLEVSDTSEGHKVSSIISIYDSEVGLFFPLGK